MPLLPGPSALALPLIAACAMVMVAVLSNRVRRFFVDRLAPSPSPTGRGSTR